MVVNEWDAYKWVHGRVVVIGNDEVIMDMTMKVSDWSKMEDKIIWGKGL